MFEKETATELLNRLKKFGKRVEFPGLIEESHKQYISELESPHSPLGGGNEIDGMPRKVTVAYTCLKCQLARRLTPIYLEFVEEAKSIEQFKSKLNKVKVDLQSFESISRAARYEKRVEYDILTYETVAHSMWKKDFGLYTRYVLLSSCTKCSQVALIQMNHYPFVAPQCKPIGWSNLNLINEIRQMPRDTWREYLWHTPYIKVEEKALFTDYVDRIVDTVDQLIK